MVEKTGEVIETPTQTMPFKAVISVDGKVATEEFFATRVEAEIYIVDAIEGSAETRKRAVGWFDPPGNGKLRMRRRSRPRGSPDIFSED